jgi:hypothetical protein
VQEEREGQVPVQLPYRDLRRALQVRTTCLPHTLVPSRARRHPCLHTPRHAPLTSHIARHSNSYSSLIASSLIASSPRRPLRSLCVTPSARRSDSSLVDDLAEQSQVVFQAIDGGEHARDGDGDWDDDEVSAPRSPSHRMCSAPCPARMQPPHNPPSSHRIPKHLPPHHTALHRGQLHLGSVGRRVRVRVRVV